MSKVYVAALAMVLLSASAAGASPFSSPFAPFAAKLKSNSIQSWFSAVTPKPPLPSQTCVHDVREYEAVVNQLPALFRAGEFFAIHDSWTLKGGIHIFKAGSRLVIEARGRMMMMGTLDEDQNIKVMCFRGSSVEVDLDDGRYDTMTIEAGGIRFHSFLFQPTNASAYTRLVSSL